VKYPVGRLAIGLICSALLFGGTVVSAHAGTGSTQACIAVYEHDTPPVPAAQATALCQVTPTVLSMVTQALDSVTSAGYQVARNVRSAIYGGRLPGPQGYLIDAVLVFLFFWYGYEILMTAGDGDFGFTLASVLRSLFIASLLGWVMYDYIPLMKDIDAGFNWMAGVFMMMKPPPTHGGLGIIVREADVAVIGFLQAMISHAPTVSAGVLSPGLAIEQGLFATLWFVMSFLSLGLLLVVFVGYAVLAETLFALATVFGPLMLVLALLPFTRRLASSWMYFTLSAGFFKLVLAAVMGITMFIITQSASLLNLLNLTSLSSLGAMDHLYISFLVLLCTFLLMVGMTMAIVFAQRITNHLLTGFGIFDIGLSPLSRGSRIGGGQGDRGRKDKDGGGGDGGAQTWKETRTTTAQDGTTRTQTTTISREPVPASQVPSGSQAPGVPAGAGSGDEHHIPPPGPVTTPSGGSGHPPGDEHHIPPPGPITPPGGGSGDDGGGGFGGL